MQGSFGHKDVAVAILSSQLMAGTADISSLENNSGSLSNQPTGPGGKGMKEVSIPSAVPSPS
jgi:hypothetical protein